MEPRPEGGLQEGIDFRLAAGMMRPGVKEQTSLERRGVGYEAVPSMVHKRSGE